VGEIDLTIYLTKSIKSLLQAEEDMLYHITQHLKRHLVELRNVLEPLSKSQAATFGVGLGH
jgi:phosphoribosyl-ATP pyrophosphohydrolase